MYPVKGSASYKHLWSPVADYMSPQRARALGNNESNVCISNDGQGFVSEEHFDVFMEYLSGELGFKVYVRDEIECILCESHPMRSLNCRDWFRKGMALFECNERGEFFRRDYGKGTPWTKLHPPEHYEFAYVEKPSIKYIPLDPKLAYYANSLGNELRLSTQDFKSVADFLRQFDTQAKKISGNDTNVRLIYLNKPGSVLSFPANQCYHATITPPKPTGYPRDMMVFHPLDGIS